jgi:hypothetical protein
MATKKSENKILKDTQKLILDDNAANLKSNKNEHKKPTMLSGLLIIGIAIVGFIFILSGMKVFFEEPKYESYCKDVYDYPAKTVKNCNNTQDYPAYCKGVPIPEFDKETGCVTSYTCSNCSILYEEARTDYSRNIFMISIGIGILMIIASAFITIPTIQNGLFITSIVLIIFGSSNYWSSLGKYLQFSLVGIALASLIIISYKIYKNQEIKNN